MIDIFLSQVVLEQCLEEVKKELEETRSTNLYVIYYITMTAVMPVQYY